MKHLALGQTGISVSALGLGTVKFGRNQQVKYPQPFEIPDDNMLHKLLSFAADHGINLLDTAPAYGNSEQRLGQFLSLHNRQQWIICTKVGEEFVDGKSHFDFTPLHFQKSIERSLKRLNTDYLDIVLVHSDGNGYNIMQKYEVFSTLEEFKQKGLIRCYGMSCKNVKSGLACINHADVAMVNYNPTHTEERAVLDAAHKLNKGILIKKALASGHVGKIANENPVQTSLQFIFNHPAVSSVIVGTINPKHLAENIQAINRLI